MDNCLTTLLITNDPTALHDPHSSILVARFPAEAACARALADRLAEAIDGAVSIAAFEDGAQWFVEIQFAGPPDEAAVRAALRQVAGEEAARALRFETVAERDWVAASLAGLKPVAAGRFVIHGAHDRERIPVNRIAVEIDAALAFGTGHHGTTRGCLLALDRLLKARASRPRKPRTRARGRRAGALDIGTGTGVLAIAVAKGLRAPVLAGDIDIAAARIAQANARHNGLGGSVEVIHAAGLAADRFRRRGPYPLVFANILLEPLKRLAGSIASRVAPGGQVVLSGLLATQENAALASYRPHGLRLVRKITLDGWVTLILAHSVRRRSASRFPAR